LSNREIRDNSFKEILDNPGLFADFIKDFLADKLPILKDVKPENIEDYKKDFYPIDTDSKHADVVKKITVKDNTLFVIALAEHQSSVDHRMSFRLLVYTVFILLEYEKEAEKADRGITKKKGFTYPPVIPIVYYDGKAEWTAPLDFLYKTKRHDLFYKYIPKFEYELIDLNKYGDADIMKFKDGLSAFLLMEKLRDQPDAYEFLKGKLGYIRSLNIDDNIKELLIRIFEGMRDIIKIPPEMMEEVADNIKKGGAQAMFEGLLEAFEEKNAQIERAFEALAEKDEALAEKEEEKETAAKKMYSKGQSVEDIADWLNLPLERVIEITRSLN
jgi:predicted transposase/invertase (TIGR01784 family)